MLWKMIGGSGEDSLGVQVITQFIHSIDYDVEEK